MLRRDNEIQNATRQRELTELAAQRPELATWLHPLSVALSALVSEELRGLAPMCAPARAPEAPMLHDAVLPLDGAAMRRHVHAVLTASLGQRQRARIESIDPLRLLELAIAQDDEGCNALAHDAGLEPQALNAAAQLAAVPVLIACAHAVAAQPLSSWPHDYCHVCGALPALAEVLGLERTRHLRCGRCGASWQSHVLLCPFCNERDHAKLGSLIPDGAQGQVVWAETCNSCQGYIKTRAALRGLSAESVLIEDARTLELDLVAVDRGYQKPARVGFPARVRIIPSADGVS
ncbi:MAG TPA: formate dehydrogenase accessory protein FdhE [Longimicrobiales bacterium]|nr:formate dehydrogenase accessory protein FdhE [Longimicrobiales bacterium]